MINDWTGHRFVTTHRCFGEPCPKDKGSLVQMADDESESSGDEDDEQQIFLNKFNLHPHNLAQSGSKWEEGIFEMGDLQEHKYGNPAAWVPGALPHADYDGVENLHSIIYDHFDPSQGRFRSEYEVQDQAQRAESHKEYLTAAKPKFKVPEHAIDDWTGTKWARNWKTFGVEEHPPEAKTREENEDDAKKFQEDLQKKLDKFKQKSDDDSAEYKLDKKDETV